MFETQCCRRKNIFSTNTNSISEIRYIAFINQWPFFDAFSMFDFSDPSAGRILPPQQCIASDNEVEDEPSGGEL